MNNIKYIGIDVHQATSVFAVSNREGRIVAEAILETRATEIIDFLKSQRGTLWVTLEEGTYANWLYDVIKPHVSKLVVCDPRQNKQHGSKTDKIDAKKLANLLRSNSLKAVYHGEDGTRTLAKPGHPFLSGFFVGTSHDSAVSDVKRGEPWLCRAANTSRKGKKRFITASAGASAGHSCAGSTR